MSQTQPPPENKFVNPWPFGTDYDSNTQGTISSVIPLHEKQFIQSLCPTKGALQIVINRLWQQLTLSLKANGITTIADAAQFKQFVGNLRVTAVGFDNGVPEPVIIARSPATGTLPEASAHDDRSGASRAPSANPQPANEPRNVPSQNERGREAKRSSGGITGKRKQIK